MVMESDREVENFVLPDTSLVLAIRYKGNVTVKENGKTHFLPPIVLSGIRKTPRHIRYEKGMPLANLHLTLLDRVGVHLDSFVDSSGKIEGLFE